MAREMKAVIIGFGTVARSLAEAIHTRPAEIGPGRAGKIRVVAIADGRSCLVDEGGVDLGEALRNKGVSGLVGSEAGPRPLELIKSVDADTVVELTPGNPAGGEPGLSHFRAALESGKNLITANKMPLALHYRELADAAERHAVALRYGACVGGGLPVFELGTACAATEPIVKIEGTFNATSNFIVTQMEDGRTTFSEALREAQRLGYAETDPTLDVDGLDAACKIVILANHFLGGSFVRDDVSPRESVRDIPRERVSGALRAGKTPRMVASAEKRLQVRVEDVPRGDPLALPGAWNAVKFHLAHSGVRAMAGPGAGGVTTSQAVLRDMLEVERLAEGTG